MNDIVYDNKKIAALLAEDKWKLAGGTSPGRVGGNILVRYLEHKADDLDHVAWEKIEAFVATWTSAKNYVDDSSPSSNTVVDPTVELGKSVEKGTWYRGPLKRERLQSDRIPQGHWRITQTLFKGAADTETEHTSEDGCRYVTYRKYYVDQVAMPDMPAKSSGVNCSRNFQVDPVTGLYNGYTERVVQLYQNVPSFYTMQDAFEKAQRVRHFGIRTGDVDENGNAISPAIPDPTAQEAGVLVQVDRTKNANCTQDADVNTTTAIEKENAVQTDRKTKFETSVSVESVNQDAAAYATAPAQTDGVIVTTQSRFNKFSLYDNKVDTDTAVAVPMAQEERTYTPFESRVETVDRNTVADPTLDSSQTAGIIKVQRDNVNDYGRHDVTTSTRTAVAVASAAVTDVREKYQTVASVDAVNQDAALTSAAQVTGTIVEDHSKLNDFNKYDTSRRTRTAVAVTDAEKAIVHEAFEKREVAVDRNQAAPTPPSEQTAGTIVEQRDATNEFNLHDVTETTRTAVAQAAAGSVDRKDLFETVSTVEGRNATDAAVAPDRTAGVIVTTRDRLNEFQRHDTEIETRTAVAVSDAQLAKTYTAFEIRAEDTDRNQVDAASLPTEQTAGTITTVEDVTNEFQRHDIKTVERTAVSQASVEVTDRREKYQTVSETKAANATEALTSGAQSAGTIVTDVSRLNEFLRYDTSRQTRTAVPVTTAVEERTYSAFESRTETLDRNTVADPTLKSSQATVGVIVTEQDSVNDFGVHDVRTNTRTAVAQAAAGATDVRTPFETVTVAEARNAASAITPGDQVAGTIKTVKDKLNDFLLHDTSLETRTAVPVVAAVESKVYTPFEIRTTQVDRHTVDAPTLPTSQTAGTIVEVEDRLTDFNDHDVTTSTRTSVDAVESGTEDHKDNFSHATVVEVRNATAPLTPGEFSAGTIVTQDSKKNDYGRFDTRETTEVAVARDHSYVSEIGEYTKVTTHEYHNADSIVEATVDGQRVSGSENRFGKFDYTNTQEQANVAVDSGVAYAEWTVAGSEYYEESYTAVDLATPIDVGGTKVYHYTYVSGVKKYQHTFKNSIFFYSTEALAVSKLNAVYALNDGKNYEGSRYDRVAAGLYKVLIVTHGRRLTAFTPLSYADPYKESH